MPKCDECQKNLTLPFVREGADRFLCWDCLNKVEEGFRDNKYLVYYETKENMPDGQIGWSEEKNAWITLYEMGKHRVVYSPTENKAERRTSNASTSSSISSKTRIRLEARIHDLEGKLTNIDNLLTQLLNQQQNNQCNCQQQAQIVQISRPNN